MQLFKINANAFQQTLTGEYDEFKEELRTNSNLAEDVSPYIDGNILFSISQESNALKELMTTAWSVAKDNENDEYKNNRNTESQPYLDDVTTTIIKSAESFSLRDALIQIGEIVEVLGDKLAGCLLVSGKTIINPLHPLSALVLIDEEANIYGQFKIVTYLYNNKRAMHYIYNSNKADMSKIRKNIMLLISLYSNKQEINKVVDVLEVNSVNDNNPLSDIERYYKESVLDDSKYDGDFIIIPHQLLTKGIVAPYYGTSVIIREDNGARGALLCPMHSANISSPLNKAKTKPEFNSICTGNTPKTTMDGLRTLAHANLSSPLHSYCMEAGSILYADECIRQSINMYRLGGFLTKQVKEETPEENTLSELEEEIERQNLRYEQADAEHERSNSDDVVDSMSYSMRAVRRAQEHLTETQRGIVSSMAFPQDAFATGTTFTRTYTNTTTPDEPPVFQPIRAADVMINLEDTDVRYIDTANDFVDETLEEMREEFGRRANEAGEEIIRELTGEQNEQQEIEQTEPTTIFADALNEGAAETDQDDYEEQELEEAIELESAAAEEREEPVPREQELEEISVREIQEDNGLGEELINNENFIEPEQTNTEAWELAD